MVKNAMAGLAVVLVLALTIMGVGIYKNWSQGGDKIDPPAVLPTVPLPAEPVVPKVVDYVQLSSHSSIELAARAVRTFSVELKGILTASELKVFKANNGYYRVMLPTSSRAEAEAKCTAIKRKGLDCLVYTF